MEDGKAVVGKISPQRNNNVTQLPNSVTPSFNLSTWVRLKGYANMEINQALMTNFSSILLPTTKAEYFF